MRLSTLIVPLGVIFVSSATAESLWNKPGNNQLGAFADTKAAGIGDLVFVDIFEETTVTTDATKSSQKNANIQNPIFSFLSGTETPAFLSGGVPLAVESQTNSNSGGSGSTSIAKSVESKIAVVVVDIFPNGNLAIEGVRQSFASGERQYVVLRGIIRREDIDASNTVMSSYIANANIEFLDEGALADAQKRSWLMKLVDKVNIW